MNFVPVESAAPGARPAYADDDAADGGSPEGDHRPETETGCIPLPVSLDTAMDILRQKNTAGNSHNANF